jgi:hypothetical protein
LRLDIGDALRLLVANRAGWRCEYCRLRDLDSYFSHQFDHIISSKHGGQSIFANLAYTCVRCNVFKGTDVGSINPQNGKLVAFFNPRRERWASHFVLRGAVIEPLTAEGAATARVLQFNLDKRVAERRLLIAFGRYP